MPIVPTISPNADPTPYTRQIAHHAPAAFGRGEGRALAGIGRSIEGVSDVAANQVIREQIKDNERQAKELDTQLTARKRELLYGENGFYNLQGRNAVAAVDQIKQQLLEIQAEIGASAGNPAVLEMYEQVAANRMEQELESIDRFTSKERRIANILASETRVNEAIQDAASDWNNPNTLARSEAIVKSEVLDQAELAGWEPEVAQSKLEEAMSGVYFSAIESALNSGNATQAREMFGKYGSKLDAPVSQKLVKEFKAEDRAARAEARSMRAEQRAIIAFNQSQEDRKLRLQDRIDAEQRLEIAQSEVDNYMDLGLTYEEALAENSKKTDVELRDEVERRLTNAHSREQSAQELAAKEAGRKLNKTIAEGSTYEEALDTLSPIERDYIFARPSMIEAGQKLERNMAEDALYSNVSDGKTLAKFMSMSTREQAEADLNTYLGVVTQAEYNKMITAQASSIRRLENNTDAAAKILDAAEQEFSSQTRGNPAFFDGSKPNDTYRRAMTDLQDWVYNQVDTTGKVPTDREARQKLAQLTTTFEGDTVWIPGIGGFKNKTIRELTADQRQVARVRMESIPSKFIDAIVADLSGLGIKMEDVSDAEIEQLAGALMLIPLYPTEQKARYDKLLDSLKDD